MTAAIGKAEPARTRERLTKPTQQRTELRKGSQVRQEAEEAEEAEEVDEADETGQPLS